MHISGSRAAVAKQSATPGKSAEVPPGLARRNLDLPPGIKKKIDGGGSMPAGIAKRFPAPAPTPPNNTADGTPADTAASDSVGSGSTVDITA